MMIGLIKKIRDWWLKNIVWRRFTIGKRFHCGRGVFLWAKNEITIGDDFYLGKYSIIETDCRIGNGVIFANNVGVVGRYDHYFQQIGTPVRLASQIRDDNYDWKGTHEITTIGHDVWVGYGSIILSGVNIAEGCIIAAGSVVTKDTEPYSIYAGVPAKKIRNRFDNDIALQNHLELRKKNFGY